MAAPIAAAAAAVVAAGSVSRQNQRRATVKKQRRKRRRQALAKVRDSELQGDGEQQEAEEGDEKEERKMEEERQRLHLEWMERERVAQEEFNLIREREEMAKRKQEEEERRIKEEWEAREKREKEEREQKQQEKRDREEAVQKMLDQAESQLDCSGLWKNPEAPMDYGTEKDRANCPFFLKTGACRFGERCSRKHAHPTCSSTLMIRGMFVTFGMEQCRRDDYDTDASLEYSEEDVQQQFLEFFEDVLPEFKSAGKVVQFKVSCNFEPHLRGNVYVQYDTEDQCKEAFLMFNGRWYAGKQLQCEFSPVTRWKTAICGLFDRHKCPKGKHCNFLHVYRNPGNEYWEADRDLHLSPERGGALSGRYSERHSERRDRSRGQRSYSPNRSYGRRWERRSRSRERRCRSRERRSRSRERRSRSWERRWSLQSSRRNKPSFRRERSRSKERSRNGNKNGVKPEKSNGSPLDQNSRSLSNSLSPKRRTSSSKDSSRKKRSSKEPERTAELSDGCPAPRLHKHSKKSKKKKSKKKKKRSRSSGGCSSADSDGDSLPQSAGKPEDRSTSPGDAEGIQSTEGDVALISSHLMHPQETSSQPCLPEGEEALRTRTESP
uniref:Zinc finger CCCH-type, RNA binding motif and serine/arginine rich 2 n=1 Tax=Paramormyrops kingsleyae TaxID=1676925 RepID=A0A3B3SUD8_9TELE|nr:U2 small nuclear ribonucleoprotein auxiliary factor 35 kDa subunit-related protein 2 isoform X2 [Paramormyrops kingsleyae]XP_023679687.1 U2 small nuclear ribonucleoprotein auxiliary factor 35 kDa subunit-related protein 2 isoform X2 [Paramormyrops kingsleyae]XP_023679688.1 U2 small nuclear ribonucleoprotein auxiliary factor 35 kDa subunit-related protein 2 isoform X2 [Paramormyrops kingsleyae]